MANSLSSPLPQPPSDRRMITPEIRENADSYDCCTDGSGDERVSSNSGAADLLVLPGSSLARVKPASEATFSLCHR